MSDQVFARRQQVEPQAGPPAEATVEPPVEPAAEPPPAPVSGWAVGFALFGGLMMVMVGMFQALEGFVAILNDQFYVVTQSYTYGVDVTVWGWIHLVLGVLVAVAGFFVFTGSVWARAVGIGFAVLNAIAQFLFMPYYPVWSLLLIALDVCVIWALCVFGRRSAGQSAYL
jgi:hypothetical protein